MQLRILTRFDCVRDRLSHFCHWKDFTALNAAVGVAAENLYEVDLDRLRSWTEKEGPERLRASSNSAGDSSSRRDQSGICSQALTSLRSSRQLAVSYANDRQLNFGDR
jgi:hypothetical protein